MSDSGLASLRAYAIQYVESVSIWEASPPDAQLSLRESRVASGLVYSGEVVELCYSTVQLLHLSSLHRVTESTPPNGVLFTSNEEEQL